MSNKPNVEPRFRFSCFRVRFCCCPCRICCRGLVQDEERERRRKNDEEDRDRKRKCDENAKATLEDTRRENIRALERRVRAAPSKLEIADEISQLAELYVKNGDSKDMQRGRRRVADPKAAPRRR